MIIKRKLSLSRLIAKVDNDFNISESDWIPRVAAWVIDALSQMRCLPMEKKRRELPVDNRIAVFPCTLKSNEIKVFDKNGCEIPHLVSGSSSCGCGSNTNSTNVINPQISIVNPNNDVELTPSIVVDATDPRKRNFVLAGNNIELNFDTDLIIVESFEVATYHDDYYDCEVPYIYDNGALLEALAWYVLFKYLSRGSKHQVYSLTTPNQILNPYLQWINCKRKAEISVKIDLGKETDKGWRNFFYNSTFDPRR